ncbi:MAG: LCP family protein [Patescibacteria group bacterium]
MDRSNFRRPEIQKQRQTQKTNFRSSSPVTEGVSARPRHFIDQPSHRGRPNPRPIMPDYQRPVAHVDAHPSRRPIFKAAVPEPAPIQTQAVAHKRPPIDMDLPGKDSISALQMIKQKAKRRKLRRRMAQSMAVAMVLVITMGGLLFSQSYLKLHKAFRGGAETAEALKPTVNPDLLKGEGRGRINILLLGRGGGSHDAPDLTDTIMIASIDPVNHTSTLLSVPRDLWVNVPDHGVMKINAAWETGVYKYLGKVTNNTSDPKAVQAGFDVIDKTITDVMGITVDYNMLVDFQAFKQAVDTVGGVTVNVPTDLIDPTMAWENAGNATLATAGIHDFDGSHALTYVRSRETTSDFARAERQRSVLVALKGRAENLGTLSNPLKLSGLISAFGDNVQTDLSLKNASRLLSILKAISDVNVNSIGLAGSADQKAPNATPSYIATGNINGQSVVLPKAGLFKYDAIQQYVRSQLKDPYIMKEKAKIIVINGTDIPSLATAKADELKSYGYNVIGVSNATNGWTTTTLIDLTHNKKYTKNYLEQRLGTRASQSLADTSIATNGADFAIIIGSNEANSTVNQAN